MAANERPIPPAGEEIHIPGPSLQPLLLTVGITVALLGVTINWILCVAGGLLVVFTLFAWIRDARAEFAHLPLEHHVPGPTPPPERATADEH